MTRNEIWPIALILASAAAVRLVGITFGLPHLDCRPDESAIVAVVNRFYGGDLNPHFFNYPSFFMIVLAAGLLAWLWLGRGLGYVDGRAGMDALMTLPTVHQAARYLSAASGVATVWVVYGVARRLFDRTTALSGATFLALAFLHVRDSHFGVTDVAATFMVVVAFACVVRLAEHGRLRDLLWAAIATGLATATKYNAALVVLPALLAILAGYGGARPVANRVGRAALFVFVMGAAFLAGSPSSLIEYREVVASLQSESRHLALGHGIVLGRGWIVHATSTLRYGLGVPLFLAGIAGLVLLCVKDRRKGALVAVFPVAYYLVLGSGYTVFARYMLPVVPFLCLTAGYAVTEAGRWIAARSQRPALAPVAVWVLAAMVVAPSLLSVVQFDRLISLTDNRLLAASWIEKRFPAGATVAQLGPEGGRVVPAAGSPARRSAYPSIELGNAASDPDVIVVQSSPLYAGEDHRAAMAAVESRYVVGADFRAAESHPDTVYDWQDEFYLPLSGFANISRPGPNLTIYVRR